MRLSCWTRGSRGSNPIPNPNLNLNPNPNINPNPNPNPNQVELLDSWLDCHSCETDAFTALQVITLVTLASAV